MTNWPFPVINGERTQESQSLLNYKGKQPVTKDTLEDLPDGNF